MKVIICGDRNWTKKKVIEDYIAALPDDTIIIQGVCRGADLIARQAALDRGLKVMDFPVKWQVYGRAAGPIRNAEMLKEQPNLVVAFHQDIGKSKGTKNMVQQALKAGIVVYHITGLEQ